SRYDLSSREARQQGVGLRLKLRIKPPELAALPWEFLYDPRQAEYICLSRDTPVIRYLELPHPIQPLVVRPPLSILGMIASPRDLSPLDIGREKRRMERAVQALQSQELVNLTWLEGQTWRDLQRAMRGGPWHIFHFIGHGGFDHTTDEGLIALADSEGMTRSFRATELGRLLADHRSLRLVLLNSCEGARASERDIFSSTASILVRRGLPAVLAMQYEITDPAAIEFARAFYEALADGLPVDAAVTEARKAVSLAVTNSVEWGIPVVYMRAPQGVIFQLPETDRVRGRPPGPPTFLDEEQEARLDQLYTEGLSAFWVEDWDRACRNFQAILDEYPGYPNATAKLEEARLQRKLNTLYAEAGTAEEAGDWAAALSALERLVSEAPDFKDAAILLETARGQKQLADLYEEVRRLYQAEQWQAVVNVFAQIQALDPGYGDPEGLLAGAGREVAALKRRAELDQLYRRAIVELDAGHWSEAQRLLASLEAQEPGFRETKRLLERAETELAREEAAQRREEQLASLYEQALGLARAGQWRGALAKLEEVHKLDPQHPDPEGIAAQAQEEIAGEEAEAQRQSELAALYAEAVQLLQSEQYQAALEKWGEVQAQDPRYPDRQKVQATARKRLNELAKAGAPRRQLPGWAMAALGLLGVVVLVAIGALLITGGGTTTPEPGASQVPGVAVKATDTPTLLPPAPEPAATEDLTPAAEEPAGATASLTDTSQPCQAASEWVEIESPWLANEVTFDGKITTAEEWSDALCLDATLAEPIWNDDEFSWGDSISSKWWIKSDAQRI
ncbi:MAG: CHAT domain-containing protein, partial [Planctomycetota bacterium]